MSTAAQAAQAAQQFDVRGECISATPHGSGHINDSYCVGYREDGAIVRYLLQRINGQVFKNPAALMHNIERVTHHLRGNLETADDQQRRVLTLVVARSGQPFHVDDEGSYWRMYLFIERAQTYDAVESPQQAFEAARAFGRFQRSLVDLPTPRLHETIPDFHNTPKRVEAFEQSIANDAAGRVKLAQPEIEFALAHRAIAGMLVNAGLPERVTHNDTKLNNVMLDDLSGEGICVIDLDTVMPGLALYDFGDMVRTTTCAAAEDETDLAKVHVQFDLFAALLQGYLAGDAAGEFLTIQERDHLVAAGKVIAYEQAIRFLADHLNGDTYYKIHRENHNLDRARTQFKLVESIIEQQQKMEALLRDIR